MLGFEERPDRVFSAIFEASLEVAADHIAQHLEDHGDTPGPWTEHFLDLAPCFSPRVAQDTIKRLLAAHRDREHIYQLTDYHRLLIYKCLSLTCDVHNDDLNIPPGETAPFGLYSIGPIDFDLLVQRFFPDIDFLFGPEMLNVAGEQRRQFMMTDEAFDLVAGHPPHPDELVLSTYAEEEGWLTQEDEYPAGGWVPTYPRPEEE
jgi:hypothetical protein